MLAGRENRVPTEAERRRLGLIAGAVLGRAGRARSPARSPLAGIAAAGPAAAGWAVARRRRNYRLAVERDIAGDRGRDRRRRRRRRLAPGRAARRRLRPARPERGRARARLLRSRRRRRPAPRARPGSPSGSARSGSTRSSRRSSPSSAPGGDLAGLLRRHGRAAAQRERAEREARSATAQARMTGGLVVAMPVVMALLVELISPGFVGGLLAEPAAALLLALAGRPPGRRVPGDPPARRGAEMTRPRAAHRRPRRGRRARAPRRPGASAAGGDGQAAAALRLGGGRADRAAAMLRWRPRSAASARPASRRGLTPLELIAAKGAAAAMSLPLALTAAPAAPGADRPARRASAFPAAAFAAPDLAGRGRGAPPPGAGSRLSSPTRST